MGRDAFRKATAPLFLANLLGYWGVLPAGLVLLGRQIDQLLRLPGLPVALGLGVGSLLVALGVVASVWVTVVLYLRGGGFPIALLPPCRLVREGPYALSRHPLYVAFTLYLVGWGAIAASLGTIAIVSFAVLPLWSLYALAYEERVLARRFGEEYVSYRRKTPFFFRFGRIQSGPKVVFALTYLLGKPLLRLMVPMRVEGREHLCLGGPSLIIANHACYLDPVFLIAASNRYIRFLTTSEMMRTRLRRWLFSRFGCLPIRRYASDPAAVRRLLACLREGEIVGLFPEGERSWDGYPRPVSETVKRLLARLEVPIVPARIEGGYAILPRWARFPLPGKIRIRFLPPCLPPFSPDEIAGLLGLIAVKSDGQTRLPRLAAGIERLLWACPSCHAIGTIATKGRTIRCESCKALWTIDRRLNLHHADGSHTPLAALAASLNVSEIPEGTQGLISIGQVILLEGAKRLCKIASGQARYQAGTLRVGEASVPLSGVRSLTIEGNTRLDIGLANGRRLRLRFLRDSPLKWQHFLGWQLGIPPNSKEAG